MRTLGLILAGLCCTGATAQPFQWTTYTSTSHIADLVATEGLVWGATSGGLFDFDPATGLFDVYTNTRGLAMNKSLATGVDGHGWIWVGLSDGRITRLDPGTGATRQIFDLQEEIFEINVILGAGEDVFVATNNGIYRFSYRQIADNYRVLESIRVLGDFSGDIAVTDLAVWNGFLYAATPQGLARVSLSAETMSAPSAWTNFTFAGGQQANNVRAVYAAESSLWIASEIQTFSFDGSDFLNHADISGIQVFAEASGHLYAASLNAVFMQDNLQPSMWAQIGQSLPGIGDMIATSVGGSQRIVLGLRDSNSGRGGLSFLEDGAWSEPVTASGIGANVITTLGFAADGTLWAGLKNVISDAEGLNEVYSFRGDEWTRHVNPETEGGLLPGDVTSIAFDHQGGVWVSSFGSGVAWIRGDEVQYFNHTDSSGFSSEGPRLIGIPGANGENFVVSRVVASAEGDIFIANRRALNLLPVVRVGAEWIAQGNNPAPWNYFETGLTITDAEVEELVIDRFNRIWAAPSTDGASSFVIDYRDTPGTPGDDSVFTYAPANYEDAAYTCYNDIHFQALDYEIDQQGYLWAATPEGAYYTQGGIPADLRQLFFICVADLPIGTRVNDIHIDAQDNKWFATDEGVAVLNRNFNWIHIFQTTADADNASDLAAKSVTAITSDPETGDVWIGTSDGLSRLRTPYASRGVELDELWPYPNPYKADGKQHMFVDHQKLGGMFEEFRIYTVSGRLVRKLTWEQMINPELGWDGRNDDGELVAGGVYLIVAATESGSAVTGKIAVLGR